MAWVMDGMVDATELWASDAYEGLPRVPLLCPLVSMEDPHIICFSLCGAKTQWLLLVDIRRKSLLSVYCRSDELSRISGRQLHLSMVSCYLDPNPSCRNGASSSKEGYTDLIPSLVMDAVDEARKNDAGNSAPSSCKSLPEPGMHASDILAGFQEVPSYGLDRDDMVKAYNILGLDNGRRIRSLLGLPKNMRKDWLLMEIKSMIA
nr:unnamed protein product [Digitaria exilis]